MTDVQNLVEERLGQGGKGGCLSPASFSLDQRPLLTTQTPVRSVPTPLALDARTTPLVFSACTEAPSTSGSRRADQLPPPASHPTLPRAGRRLGRQSPGEVLPGGCANPQPINETPVLRAFRLHFFPPRQSSSPAVLWTLTCPQKVGVQYAK